MKKLFRWMLCAGLMAALLCVPAFAAQSDAPERQGDFYVLVNGSYVTFSDAVPQIRDNRSCLPFVAVFEQLGFPADGMTWDKATKTVTAAKDGQTIALTIGQPSITLTAADGTSRVIETDAAPYVDGATDRTYVPFGLVASALGYQVGWDPSARAVIIDDIDAILAANTATYERMDQYMAYSRSFNQGDQKASGEYAMDLDMAMAAEGMDMAMQFSLDGGYEMLMTDSSAFQFDTDMDLDWAVTLNGADATELLTGTGEGPQMPERIDMEMRGDLAEGLVYLQSAALSQVMGQNADTWYKLDLAGMYSQMGIDYGELMKLALDASGDMGFEEYLDACLRAMAPTSVDATASDVLAVLNAICADSAFRQSGSDYVNDTFLAEEGVTASFTLYTKDGKVNGCGLTMSAALDGLGQMEIAYDLRDKEMQMTMGMAMDAAELGEDVSLELTMTMDGTYQASTAKPETAPPANAAVADLSELMGISPLAAA